MIVEIYSQLEIIIKKIILILILASEKLQHMSLIALIETILGKEYPHRLQQYKTVKKTTFYIIHLENCLETKLKKENMRIVLLKTKTNYC